MKTQIEVAVNWTTVNRINKEVELPTETKYYTTEDNSRFFGRGTILFAIICTTSPYAFYLIEVTRNTQSYDDFRPKSDCRSSEWIKHSGLRNVAFDIITQEGDSYLFKEISEADFFQKRGELLDSCINDFIRNKETM